MADVKYPIMAIAAALRAGRGLDNVPENLATLLDDDAWRLAKREDGSIYGPDAKWLEFRTTQSPWGLGVQDPKVLFKICGGHAVEVKLRNVERITEIGRPESVNGDNITNKGRVTGTSRAYTKDRLARERPDLLERVNAGEISANAAAIEAGFRKKPTPLGTLRAAWRKATPDEREEFLKSIQEETDEHP